MKTYVPKLNEIKRTWYVVDAKGQVLGRLASQVAKILMGKHKPTYQPNYDNGDFVIVINAKDVKLTGKKERNKFYYWHTGYVGHIRSISYGELREKKPEFMFWLAVKRMLPKNKLRKKFLRKLKVYAGPEHPHAAQQPIPLKFNN